MSSVSKIIITFCYCIACRIKHARNILCDEESRRKYDHWRRSGIAVPYEHWIQLSGAVHTSLHWAAKPRKELMIEFKNGKFMIIVSVPKNISTSPTQGLFIPTHIWRISACLHVLSSSTLKFFCNICVKNKID